MIFKYFHSWIISDQSNRFPYRTKEETEAAHDLLQLSRSLPPLTASPLPLDAGGASSPTPLDASGPPPSSHQYPQQPHHHFNALIYINPAAAGGQAAAYRLPITPPISEHGGSSGGGCAADFPQQSTAIRQPTSQEGHHSAQRSWPIADGRTKASGGGLRHGAPYCFADHPSSSSAAGAAVLSPDVLGCGGERPKYTCSECGKHYATSSNLSRHKQTHRSLDSGSARQCPICLKNYVSMPALSMHVLTHSLNHRCELCGKAFSRPWLLQGHLRQGPTRQHTRLIFKHSRQYTLSADI